MDPAPTLIFKIADTKVAEAARAEGSFPRMPIDDRDGYIHFSTAAQLRETLRLHFAGQGGLTLIALPLSALGEGLRWEPSRGGQMFPHHYGPLAWDVGVHTAIISVGEDGSVTLPDWVQ